MERSGLDPLRRILSLHVISEVNLPISVSVSLSIHSRNLNGVWINAPGIILKLYGSLSLSLDSPSLESG